VTAAISSVPEELKSLSFSAKLTILQVPGPASALKPRRTSAVPLAFTLAPHLQIINYRGRFSRFHGI
jgi:hypothetical protein